MRALKALFGLLLLCVAALAADSPFSGTWKLHLAKSKLLPGDTTTSDVYHVVADDMNVKFTEEWTDAKGVRNISSEGKWDGKDYPIKGDPESDTISYHREGSHAFTDTIKKNGKVIATGKVAVSEDGQTETVDFTVYAEGKAQNGVAVYEKQHE